MSTSPGSTASDAVKQRAAIDNMASQKWDFVAIQAFGIGTLTAPVNKMIDAGIPVIDMDTLIAPVGTINVLTYLAPVNEYMGSSVTQTLVDAINGEGTMVMTQGALGHTGAQGRAKGFHSHLSLASRHAPGGDEVAATLAALKAVTLKGCIVTADALHCHPRMASQIRAQGGHYALKLKANHGPLFACALKGFAAMDAKGELASYEKAERGHDRSERRRACVIAAPSDAPAFPGLAALGRIESERRQGEGKTVRWVHYVALSKKLSPRRMLEVNRTHWSVENHLHWPLDVVFHEDDARTRKDYGPQNLAVVRRMAADILGSHPDNRSLARKMKLAAWNKEFFYALFAHMR